MTNTSPQRKTSSPAKQIRMSINFNEDIIQEEDSNFSHSSFSKTSSRLKTDTDQSSLLKGMNSKRRVRFSEEEGIKSSSQNRMSEEIESVSLSGSESSRKSNLSYQPKKSMPLSDHSTDFVASLTFKEVLAKLRCDDDLDKDTLFHSMPDNELRSCLIKLASAYSGEYSRHIKTKEKLQYEKDKSRDNSTAKDSSNISH